MKNRTILYDSSRTDIRAASAREASAKFAEWTSLFSGKIFVTLTVYIDESGTHNPMGSDAGSEAPVFGGFMETVHRWTLFRLHWARVLEKYNVPYFHYREFSPIVKTRNDPKSPYYGWNDQKRDNFVFELAAVAGHQVPIGSMIMLKGIVGHKADDVYSKAMDHCFHSVIIQLNAFWPNQKDKINFIFDQYDPKSKWIGLWADIFSKWREKEPRLGTYSFADKKDPAFSPLQSADLFAYRVRKGARLRLDSNKPLHSGWFYQFLLRRLLHDPEGKLSILRSRRAALRAAQLTTEEKFGFKQDLSE